ncbi:MAG: hypothetical protein ACREEK_23940 [Bradyrhizobium sp.]
MRYERQSGVRHRTGREQQGRYVAATIKARLITQGSSKVTG